MIHSCNPSIMEAGGSNIPGQMFLKKMASPPFKKKKKEVGLKGDRFLWIEGKGEEDKKKGKLLRTLYQDSNMCQGVRSEVLQSMKFPKSTTKSKSQASEARCLCRKAEMHSRTQTEMSGKMLSAYDDKRLLTPRQHC